MPPPTDKKLTAEEWKRLFEATKILLEEKEKSIWLNSNAHEQLESERQMNAVLTEENNRLRSLQQEREPDGWLCEDETFFKQQAEAIHLSKVEGFRKSPIPVYFSPSPVREVSDQEIQDAAFLKARIESERGKPVAAKYFALGAKHVRSLLSGERKEKG